MASKACKIDPAGLVLFFLKLVPYMSDPMSDTMSDTMLVGSYDDAAYLLRYLTSAIIDISFCHLTNCQLSDGQLDAIHIKVLNGTCVYSV